MYKIYKIFLKGLSFEIKTKQQDIDPTAHSDEILKTLTHKS